MTDMTDPLVLPPGLALGIIAFLLSLLPAGLFIWLWYLRHHERPVPPKTVGVAFLAGLFLVLPAFKLEDLAGQAWQAFSPDTAHYFFGAVLPLQTAWDIVLPAVGTFLVVATVEEGLRYVVLRWWIARSAAIDQIFDGLVIGVAMGLGFATLENTIYFLEQLKQANYDTLVFVFFLRFLISTLAHICFGGLMGTAIARGQFNVYRPRPWYIQAFFVSWFLHGLYDLLLGIDRSFYAVFLLIAPLAVLVTWTGRRDFFIIHRRNGHLLLQEEAPHSKQADMLEKFLRKFESPWNVHAPWLSQSRQRTLLLKNEQNES
jgi:RsiW-degrading membrane proteinase PrsW (M82 family)